MSEQYKFAADTGKILDIVIDSLYSQKEIFCASWCQMRLMP